MIIQARNLIDRGVMRRVVLALQLFRVALGVKGVLQPVKEWLRKHAEFIGNTPQNRGNPGRAPTFG